MRSLKTMLDVSLLQIIQEGPHSLFIGQGNILKIPQQLAIRNIKTIVCVDINYIPLQNIKYYTVILQGNYIEVFQNICKSIETDIKKSSILIVCSNGLSGSPTIAISYLLTKGWQYEKAFYWLKDKKSTINPTKDQKYQLTQYYDFLQKNQKIVQRNDFKHFASTIQELLEKQQIFYEESPVIFNDSFQDDGIKTPGFTSPVGRLRNSIRKPSFKKSNFMHTLRSSSVNKEINNYSFQEDLKQEQVEINSPIKSPCFVQVEEIDEIESEELIRLRHRRHRKHFKTKSAHQN